MTPTQEALREVLPYLPEQFANVEHVRQFQPEIDEALDLVRRLRVDREAVRVSDLRRPTEVGTTILVARYLRSLRQTLWAALGTMILSAAMGIPAITALILFIKDGTSFLHPYLAMFFILGSIALLVLAVMSAFAVKKRIESEVWRVLKIFVERA